MARLIEADALKVAIRDDANIDGRNYARVKMHINEAEAVELVMCKDCINWGAESGIATHEKGFRYARCAVHNHKLDDGKHIGWCPKEDYFCSLGERKDNG